jgi:hypothetical protein
LFATLPRAPAFADQAVQVALEPWFDSVLLVS